MKSLNRPGNKLESFMHQARVCKHNAISFFWTFSFMKELENGERVLDCVFGARVCPVVMVLTVWGPRWTWWIRRVRVWPRRRWGGRDSAEVWPTVTAWQRGLIISFNLFRFSHFILVNGCVHFFSLENPFRLRFFFVLEYPLFYV